MRRTRPENFGATTFNCKTPSFQGVSEQQTFERIQGEESAGQCRAATYAKGIIIHWPKDDGNNGRITQARQMN